MTCRKCRAPLPEDAIYCCRCGAKQNISRKPKSRGNGQGSVYQLPNKSWIAIHTISYYPGPDGKPRRKTVSKAGFKTKKAALEYLPQLLRQPERKKDLTFAQVYDTWVPTHTAGKSTMDCYKAAYGWFSDVQYLKFPEIDIDDLQACLDDCPKGRRTKENMKALCNLLYKYAIPRHYASLNLGQYLVIRNVDIAAEKDALPLDAVEKLRSAIGAVPYADYIVAQCYLGFRPSELLALDVRNYDRASKTIIGGAKTDAGRNRIVTISPKIQSVIDRLSRDRISGPMFCGPGGAAMSIESYRDAFYSALAAVGIDNPMVGEGDARRHQYTPHSCRHTFATLLKSISAPDQDKLRLIGHTSTDMLRHYQDTNLDDLRRITDAI